MIQSGTQIGLLKEEVFTSEVLVPVAIRMSSQGRCSAGVLTDESLVDMWFQFWLCKLDLRIIII